MHRLRDLDRGQRIACLVLVLLVLVPFGASVARAYDRAWIPSGDNALIGLRSYDVFTEHRPLVGQPSTSHLYGPETGSLHPGPIEFYWLAVPLRALGPAVGMIVASGLANLAGVLVAAWVIFRRAGPWVGLGSLALLGGVLWSEGTMLLTDPISSNAGGLPLLALAALCWAVVDGDHRLLPLAALFGSWVAQQHLAIVAPAAALVAFALVGAGVTLVARRRAGTATEPVWPWLAGAAVVGAICWAPVAYQQLTGDPGNITAVLDYARSSDTIPLGRRSGVRQAIRALGVPPVLVRSDLTGLDFHEAPLGVVETLVAAASYLVLAGTAIVAWRRRRTLALLAATALVLAAGGVYNGSTIPQGIEAYRINFYRWTFVVAWLAWLAFGWLMVLAVGALADRRGRPVPPDAHRIAVVLAAVVLVLPAVATVATSGVNDRHRDQEGFRVMRSIGDVAMHEAGGSGRITLVLDGSSARSSSGPALALRLTTAGHEVVLPNEAGRFYGDQRILRPGGDPGDLVLALVTGRGQVPSGPGRVIARVDLNAPLRATLAPLIAQYRGVEAVPGPRAVELLHDTYRSPEAEAFAAGALARIGSDPYSVLTDPGLAGVIASGYFVSPVADPRALAALARLPRARSVNDDDVFELRVLMPDDVPFEMFPTG